MWYRTNAEQINSSYTDKIHLTKSKTLRNYFKMFKLEKQTSD